jgi:hypothetical protein
MVSRPPNSTLFAVSLVGATTIALQVVLTRMFSAMLAYHFSFLAISLAMLGTGGGALLVYLSQGREPYPLDLQLSRWSVVLCIGLVVAPFAITQIDFGEGDTLDPGFILRLGIACIIAGIPSFAGGVVMALAMSRLSEWIGIVYAFDLAGAGLGAALIVPVLWLVPAPQTIVLLAVPASAAALLFSTRHKRARVATSFLAMCTVVLFAGSVTSALPRVPIGHHLPEGSQIAADRWTPLSRVMGVIFPPGFPWNVLFYDKVFAPVPIVRDGQRPGWPELRSGPQSIGYELAGAGRVLVIGGGGGRDIDSALALGRKEVDVIELNPGIRRVVDDDLAPVSGRPYSAPGVATTIGDGRSVLAGRDTRYQHIHIGFTDTFSVNAAAGFALTENNLYTIEAFDTYLDHLAPRGILNVSRLLKLVGDEALRTAVLALATLAHRGVADPRAHVVVIRGEDVLGGIYGTVLVRNEPFAPAELEYITRLASERGQGILFGPGANMEGEWRALAEASSIEAFCTAHALNVCPSTDDQPFFFNMRRIRDLGRRDLGYRFVADPTSVLIVTVGLLLILSLAVYGLPLISVDRSRRPLGRPLIYFAAIGVGFMLVEISLVQRFVLFLGYPTYSLSVVLFSLLVSTGLGSYLTTRTRDTRRLQHFGLATAVILIVASAIGLQPLLRAWIGLAFSVRIALSVLILMPFGLALGVAMPIGLRELEQLHAPSVPYAWGVNGIASVIASAAGVAIAIYFGFRGASLVAAACYAIALASIPTRRRFQGAT